MKLAKTILRRSSNEHKIINLPADKNLTSTEGTVLLGVQADRIEELLKASEAKQTFWHNLNRSRQGSSMPKESSFEATIEGGQEEDPIPLFKALQERYPNSDFVIKLVGYQPTPLGRLTTQIAICIAGTHKLVPNLVALEDIHLSGQPLSSFLAPTLVLNLDGQVVVIQPELEDPTTEQLQENLNLLSCLTLATPRLLKEYSILLDFVGTVGAILAKQQITRKGKPDTSSLPTILSNLKWDPVQQRLVFVDIIAAASPETKKPNNHFQRLFITMIRDIQLKTMAYIIGILSNDKQVMDRRSPFSLKSRLLLTLGQIIGLG